MTAPAEVAVERRNASVIARVAGEVDMTNAGYLKDELIAAVPNDAHALVVDLAHIRYLDSAGIELLFELARRLQRRRQDLRLVLPGSSPLRRVLALTEVSTVAPIHETLEAALAGGAQ